MTEHEFFKLLADVDEDLVIDAKAPADLYNDPFSDLPQKIRPVRRSPWKPLAAAAACLAVIAVGLAVVFNIRGRNIDSVQLVPSAKEGYPQNAVYQYKGDFSELEIAQNGISDMEFVWDIESAVRNADLIVVGTFVDDAYQTFDPAEGLPDNYHSISTEYSYNKLRIDKVIKGSVKVGDEIIVSNRYYVSEGCLYHSGITPMIKGDTWCYILDNMGSFYYASFSNRYPVPDSVQPEFAYMNNVGGLVSDGNFKIFIEQYYETDYEYVKGMLGGDPEILKQLRVEYNGLIYNVANYGDFDGVKFSIGATQKYYAPGNYVEVLAVVENTTDKPIGLLMPVIGEDSHTQVDFDLYHYGRDWPTGGFVITTDWYVKEISLREEVDGDKVTGGDDALSSYIIQPSETYYQAMRFSTYEQRYKAEDTVIADHVSLGEYHGTAEIKLLSDPNDTLSTVTTHTLSGLTVYIFQEEGKHNFTMDEFPGVEFICDGENLTARVNRTDTTLYSGSSIGNLYLIDLNGDGKRELCSSVLVSLGDVIDNRILAFDYANGKLYALADRGNYDYSIEVGGSAGNWYANAAKYDYTHHSCISSEPLSLGIMTEVKSVTTEIAPKIETAKLAGSNLECEYCEFSMVEFQGVKFYCKDNELYADSESLNPVKCNYDALYIADLNGDNKREILAVCRGNTEHTWVFIFDYANKAWYHIPEFEDGYNHFSLYWDGEEDIFLVTNGKRSQEPLMITSSTEAEVVRDQHTRRESFTMSEFPGIVFAIEGYSVVARPQNGEAQTLITFPDVITKLYLQDLNGDGRRDIAAEGWSQAGQRSETFIQAYDIAGSKLYELTADKRYYSLGSCSLNIGSDGKVYAELRTVLSERLTLDIMSQVREDYEPQVEVILDDSVHKDSFTMPEYPGYEFFVENGGITAGYTAVKWGSASKRLSGTAVVEKIYLFDTNRNNKREIVAVVKRSGEENPVVCTIHMDRLGYFTAEFKEPGVDIQIKDGKLIYSDSIEWMLEHSFSN